MSARSLLPALGVQIAMVPLAAGWASAGKYAAVGVRGAGLVLPAVCRDRPRSRLTQISASGNPYSPDEGEPAADKRKGYPWDAGGLSAYSGTTGEDTGSMSGSVQREKSAVMEEKLARWRAQAEAQRLQDKDSAVSRARASRLSRENADDEANEDSILNDDNIGGPRGSARRTVVERMRELKISERRAEISEDVQRMRQVEEDEKDREQRVQAQEVERLRIEQEIQEDAKKWAERKRAYWKEGFDAVKDVPAPDPRSGGGKQTQQGLAREIFLDAIGVQNRPLAGINAKLQDWKEMSAARKARQVGRVSVDLAVTIMNAVAIAMGIILQKPVQVPETSFRGESIRATSETLGAKFLSSVLGWGSTTLNREEKQAANVPTWKDLGPAVSTILQASDQATVAVPGISDVGAEYEAMADEETDYLQQKLREKWRKKALDKRAQRAIPNAPAQAPYVPSMEDACIKMAALIKEGDYGGVRALLRDTIEAPEVYRVLLGFDSSEYQYGNPCLILAAQLGRGDIVEALRNAGANMRVLDERGRTASQVAEEAGHLALAKNLITWAALQQ